MVARTIAVALLSAALVTTACGRAREAKVQCDGGEVTKQQILKRAKDHLDQQFGVPMRKSYEPYTISEESDQWRVEGTFHGGSDTFGGAPIVTLTMCGEVSGVKLGV